MLSATHNPRLLIIRETPSVWSVVGAILIVFGTIFVIGTLLRFHDFSRFLFALYIFFWLVMLSIGLLSVFYEPAAKIMIDRRNCEVRISARKLIGWSRKVLSFDEIKYFRLIENKDRNGNVHSEIGLELRTGEVLKIKMMPRHVEEFECRYILEINEILRKVASK